MKHPDLVVQAADNEVPDFGDVLKIGTSSFRCYDALYTAGVQIPPPPFNIFTLGAHQRCSRRSVLIFFKIKRNMNKVYTFVTMVY
jgi:hypothetical protein